MRYKGIAYPIIKHPQGYFHSAATDMDQVKSDLAAIILTEPGQRIFVPNFGTALNTINLNAPMEMARSEAKMKIATALKKWEKRIQVHDIVVDFARDADTKKLILKINVLFIDPINIKSIESLTVYKSFGGLDGRNMPF